MADRAELRRILRTIKHYKSYGLSTIIIKSHISCETINALRKEGYIAVYDEEGSITISWT